MYRRRRRGGGRFGVRNELKQKKKNQKNLLKNRIPILNNVLRS